MRARLKYPCKVGKTLYPKDTEVEVLGADHRLVQEAFPNIRSNKESPFAACLFPERTKVTIHSKDHLIFEKQEGED